MRLERIEGSTLLCHSLASHLAYCLRNPKTRTGPFESSWIAFNTYLGYHLFPTTRLGGCLREVCWELGTGIGVLRMLTYTRGTHPVRFCVKVTLHVQYKTKRQKKMTGRRLFRDPMSAWYDAYPRLGLHTYLGTYSLSLSGCLLADWLRHVAIHKGSSMLYLGRQAGRHR